MSDVSNGLVTITRPAVLRFRQSWPASGLPDSQLLVSFDRNGDLQDYRWADPDATDPEPGKRSLSVLIEHARSALLDGESVVNAGLMAELVSH